MATLTPHMAEQVLAVVQRAAAAGHGGKADVYQAACRELGISLQTLHGYMRQVSVRPTRKQRSDAGRHSLTLKEAQTISAFITVHDRQTGKRLRSIDDALAVLRANGEVRAEALDEATGEVRPLSASAVARSLRAYGVHPDQLARPEPAQSLRSLHPNHVWQIDASMCVLYYLNARNEREAGLQVMERNAFYKNKPQNIKRIENDRIWSYEWTDHYTGAIGVHYVLGAESAVNLIESFVFAVCKREGDPFHGVPRVLMMDMGSANTSGAFKNLARRMGIELMAHAPGNARATGQVEKARDIIECGFEPALKTHPVHSLDEINALAQQWAVYHNSHKLHTRYGKTRYDLWMTIKPEQLRIAPSREHCLALVNDEPVQRKVNDFLRVSYKGRDFDVRDVPGVMVGEKLDVALNPWKVDGAVVVTRDANGHELLVDVPEVARDDAGFALSGNVIGEDFKAAPRTELDANRASVMRIAMDAETDAEAEAKARAKAVPFGGRIDPFKHMREAPKKTFMPRKGTELAPAVQAASVATTPVAEESFSLFEAAGWLAKRDARLEPAEFARLKADFPDGRVPLAALEQWQARRAARSGLSLVAGGAR